MLSLPALKLFRVVLSGPEKGFTAYVVAKSIDTAVEIFQKDLAKKGRGFDSDRVLSKVELIAENNEFTKIFHLYIEKEEQKYYEGTDEDNR